MGVDHPSGYAAFDPSASAEARLVRLRAEQARAQEALASNENGPGFASRAVCAVPGERGPIAGGRV